MIIRKIAAYGFGFATFLAGMAINETSEYTQNRHFQQYGPHDWATWAFENGIAMETLNTLAIVFTFIFLVLTVILACSCHNSETPKEKERSEPSPPRIHVKTVSSADFLAGNP